MINKSFQLLRTDPLLTTNLKVVVTSDYNLYLESFNSNSELSNIKYKHFSMQKTDFLENKIPYFYKGLPIELAYDIRYDGDNGVIQNSYSNQFDSTYYAGGGYIEDQWHSEEFDYLAPLYIRKDNIPTGFVILRVDEPSGYNLNSNNDFELNSLTSTNFNEIITNWKCVKYFDMTYQSNLGEWLYNNYINNDRYPKTAFEYHPEKSEFSHWFGMDYTSGIYTHRSIFMDDRDEIETPHFRWEKFITEGYKRSGLIFPYILNLKFLFDDTPATPSSLRKYSMNRYYGFYIDNLDYVGSITSYRTPEMIPDTYLVNNIIVSGFTGMTTEHLCNLAYFGIPSVNPFVEKWNENKEYYVFIDNTSDQYRTKTISGLYPVQRVNQNNQWIYKVVANETLDNYWNIGYTNLKTVDINYSEYNIISAVTSDFSIDKYINCSGVTNYMYADLYLININDKYHVLKYGSGLTNSDSNDYSQFNYYIQTDYGINLNSTTLEYWILGKNSEFYRQVPVQTTGDVPLTFPIYRIKFTDIKDFDFDRVNTQYSDFDYEKTEYVNTDEEKLYAFDYNDSSIPPSKRTGRLGYDGQYQISSISSEYIADDELFEISDLGQQNTFSNNSNEENKVNVLNDIWRKNQSIVKWGFMGSISHSDYPYKLNNNYEVGGPYNRTTDPFYTIPDPNSKNMDYFYRLGGFYDTTTGNTILYKNQSTNIQYDYITGQVGNGFDIKAYFDFSDVVNTGQTFVFDYFTFFFKNKMKYEDNSVEYVKSYDKYAVFNYGDQYVPSVTLFKGLKIKVKEVQSVYTDTNNNIVKVLYGNKTYNNYKISIIFNENHDGINSGVFNDTGYIDTTENGISIIMNEKFQNILIVVNAKFSGSTTTLNDLSTFSEKDGLYYGKKLDGTTIPIYQPNLFTAQNFINAINDFTVNYGLTIKYYFIREYNNKFYYGKSIINPNNLNNSTMASIPNWGYAYPPFMLNIETPVNISLNNNCYTTYPYYVSSVNNDYVATLLSFDETKSQKTSIYRFPGPYEPIFKDVNLFKGGFFCYDLITGSTIVLTASTISNASVSFENPIENAISWSSFNSMCNTDAEKFVELNCPSTGGTQYSKSLSINGFDFSTIPVEALITGIKMTLTRRAFVYKPGDPNKEVFAEENTVCLSRNCSIFNSNLSENKAQYDVMDPEHYWTEDLKQIVYGGNTDTWGDTTGWSGSTLTGSDVRNTNFGVIIRLKMTNTTGQWYILPQIKCVQLTINYQWNGILYTANNVAYFDNNYKFDTDLDDFGKIDELIYSKVNESNDVLLNTVESNHIYPSIDNFGYTYSDRFVFKSSWDKEFFIKTENNLLDESGIV